MSISKNKFLLSLDLEYELPVHAVELLQFSYHLRIAEGKRPPSKSSTRIPALFSHQYDIYGTTIANEKTKILGTRKEEVLIPFATSETAILRLSPLNVSVAIKSTHVFVSTLE